MPRYDLYPASPADRGSVARSLLRKMIEQKLDHFSWQEFVDDYRTFAAEIGCDVKQIRELLDETKSMQ